ncbi:GTP-binding protein Era [hydrothermal vent metagenome]|uniref:GTP-binding protein Era n=1 Tax=hydrothermal vent metagenome TaxID=652676 RepID=A0A3B0TQQ8_9ZZZZ
MSSNKQEQDNKQPPENNKRCGFIALLGAPNAGKSTLLNAVVGAKISIVTHKAQTTRSQIRGVVNRGDSQIVFIDTPGVFSPKRRLDRAMVKSAWSGAREADFAALIIDAHKGITPEVDRLLEGLKNAGNICLLVLNKIDKINPENLLSLSAQLNERGNFAKTFMVSALKGHGLEDFVEWAKKASPPGPWHFPEDQITDLSLALSAAEVTREKLFLRIHEEIPYNITVETESFKVQKDGSYRIEQVIYVTRDGHKKIVLGKGGQTIKNIGAEARRDLSEMFETKVHLFLFVKVRASWADDPSRYREMGLEFHD